MVRFQKWTSSSGSFINNVCLISEEEIEMQNIIFAVSGSALWLAQLLGVIISAVFLLYFCKNNKKGFRILSICLLTTIFGLLLLSIIPNFMRMPRHPYKEANITGNMHTLKLVL
jgi:hypothetical protein